MFLGPAVEMLQCERYTQTFSERVPKVVISVNAMMTILWCQCQEIVSVREELKKEALREGLVAGVGSGREQNEHIFKSLRHGKTLQKCNQIAIRNTM